MIVNEDQFLKITGEITTAFLSRNAANADEIVGLIKSIHATLVELASGGVAQAEPVPQLRPVVTVAASISPDYLICLDCGRRLKSLSFHLKAHGLSPEGYRAKWGLPSDYSMAAPNLKARRSVLAHESHFGFHRKLRVKKRGAAE